MTFIQKFNSIQKKFMTADTSRLSESFAIQVNLTDSDCMGTFYIAWQNDTLSVEPYDYNDHTAMITTDSKTLNLFLDGKKDLWDMELWGNTGNVIQLQWIFPKKKAAPKKKAIKNEIPKIETAQKKTIKKEIPKKETIEKKTDKKEMLKKETTEKAVKSTSVSSDKE